MELELTAVAEVIAPSTVEWVRSLTNAEIIPRVSTHWVNCGRHFATRLLRKLNIKEGKAYYWESRR